MLLYNVSTQELFQERRMWDRVCLKTSKCLIFNKAFGCGMAKPGTNCWKSLENIFTQKLL